MCLPVLIHKLADKQEDKLQDGSPVSASYVKNGISKPQEGILHEAPFWRERGTSLRLVESRIHFVRTKENIRM